MRISSKRSEKSEKNMYGSHINSPNFSVITVFRNKGVFAVKLSCFERKVAFLLSRMLGGGGGRKSGRQRA